MTIAFLQFLANLIIALALMRLIQAWLIDKYGDDNAFAKAISFLH